MPRSTGRPGVETVQPGGHRRGEAVHQEDDDQRHHEGARREDQEARGRDGAAVAGEAAFWLNGVVVPMLIVAATWMVGRWRYVLVGSHPDVGRIPRCACFSPRHAVAASVCPHGSPVCRVNIRALAAEGVITHASLRDCLCQDAICGLFEQFDAGSSGVEMRRATMEQERANSATAAAPVAEGRGVGAAAVEYSGARLEDSFSEP